MTSNLRMPAMVQSGVLATIFFMQATLQLAQGDFVFTALSLVGTISALFLFFQFKAIPTV